MWTPLSKDDAHCNVKHFVALLVIFYLNNCLTIFSHYNLKFCLIIVFSLFYYSTNGNEDSVNDGDGNQKRDVKSDDDHPPPPEKRDVKDVTRSTKKKSSASRKGKKGKNSMDSMEHDDDSNGKNNSEVTSKSDEDKKHVVTADNKKRDVTAKADNKKRDVNKGKGTKNVTSVSSDSEELVVKRQKTTTVSLRKSACVQKRKDDQKKILAKLKIKRSKSMAGQFVLSESDFTYRAPKGFYGDFGVQEKKSIQGRTADDEEEEEEGSSSTEKVVLKKPKEGFIENQLFDDNDDEMELSDETLKNNISRIS